MTYHFPPEIGGIQTRMANYLACLSKDGIRTNVFVVRPAGRFKGHGVSSPNLRVVRLDGGLSNLPRDFVLLLSTLARQRVDVVHVFTGASTALGMMALFAGRSFHLAAAMSVFGKEDFALPSRFARVLLSTSISLSTVVLTNSEATAKLLPPKARKKARILLGGAQASTEDRAGTAMGNGKSVLFVGRLVKRKGVADLIDAMALVRSQIPVANLTIVGDGSERKSLEEKVAKLGLGGAVAFKGTLRGKDLQDEYERCSVFTLPSKEVAEDSASEGLGLALIEAAMHAKPLVGTLHGGIPELVYDGRNGLLVPPGDPAALAKALINILSNVDLARSMGEEALRMARTRFSWERATDVLLESYA
ncbi:MAG: glycosyltransferase family 4 protein [Thaumarchaeota archaeon]|nr:glycosyltransferase family 4 protein [Nitrososphaerota archaeon]